MSDVTSFIDARSIDRWDSIPSVLTSENSSPAAKRLALRLLVSLYVLQPQLIERSFDSFNTTRPDPNGMVSILPHLAGFMQHMVVQLSECSPLHAQHQSGFQERMNCAMLLSLFAVCASLLLVRNNHNDTLLQLVDLTTRAIDKETGAPFRPYTLAAVMRLLRFVMLIDATLSARTVVSPCPDLDAPQVVIVLWRHFVPWMWRLLEECNVSDAETIVFLVSTPSSSLGNIFIDESRQLHGSTTLSTRMLGLYLLLQPLLMSNTANI